MKELLKIVLYKPLYNLLVFLAWLVPGHSVGWAIIIVTLMVRLALLPSSLKATRSQKRMRDLAPEIAKIKEQYKGDRQGEAAATMALYKKHGVSPWSSCLPLLIQLPILIILYRVLMSGLVGRLDLIYSFTPHVDVNVMWLGLDLAKMGSQVFPILPILAGLAQFVNSWQMKQLNPTVPTLGKDGKPKDDFSRMLNAQMMFVMPIFTVIIGFRLPGALALYWLITTLFSIVQTWWVMKDKSKVKSQKSKVAEGQQSAGSSEQPTQRPTSNVQPMPKTSLLRRLKRRRDVTVEIRRKSD
jgi:YidC/Oxa1 family membrane protein insertase